MVPASGSIIQKLFLSEGPDVGERHADQSEAFPAGEMQAFPRKPQTNPDAKYQGTLI